MRLLQSGEKAPFFNLINQNGMLISSSSFLGKKMLIYFYPKAMTPGCTIQATSLQNNIDTFRALDIEIIGISTDKPEKLLKFSKKEMLNFTLLSDKNHQISEQFGVWGEKKFMNKIYHGIHRISFFINKNGIIEQVFKDFKPENHVQIIINYLNNTK